MSKGKLLSGKVFHPVSRRYWIQAGQQVSSDWEIVKLGDVGVPKSWTEWLQGREGDCRIGIDPKLISASETFPHLLAIQGPD